MFKIGIRREDKSEWEARVPVVPEHVADLTDSNGMRFHVQPSDQRIFTVEEFAESGAEITESLADCPIIMGVKEVPADQFEDGKTYVFFSHTIKGQSYNMPMLRSMMERGCSLIDYERITDDDGSRLVFFGYHAGLAGMIDTLWSLGQRLRAEGRDTPLSQIKPAHGYEGLRAAKEHLAQIATQIASSDVLNGLGPIVCGFAGYGQVSRGAQEVYDVFAPAEVTPDELSNLADGDGRFYKVVFEERHMVEPTDKDADFDLQDYYDNPERYRSIFSQYLPHLTMLVNCIYWEPQYPRLVTVDALQRLYGNGAPRLRVIGDISCDPEGSIECTVKPTDPGDPVYVYDVARTKAVDGFQGNGPVIMAVEILPTELPRDSSAAFSTALLPFLPGLAAADPSGTFDEWNLPAPLKRAAILHKGRLTPEYEYLREYLV